MTPAGIPEPRVAETDSSQGGRLGTLPGVAVVMPVLNERRHLRAAVEAILAQDYAGEMEIVLALGPSTDGTDEVAADLVAADPRIRTVPNPTGLTPSGLNAAIGASTHGIVVRVDGHSMLPPEYVRTAVEELTSSGADNVGGVMAAEGVTPFEQAVARAYRSWFGIGAAQFHLGGDAGPADTVYLGVFRREMLERIGGFDEKMRRAQDWELNYRIRQAGGLVWFTPRMQVTYRPRADLRALSKQFFRTGQWRRQVTRVHRGTASPRYLAAPLAVVGVVGGSALALAGHRIGLLGPLGYLGAVLAGSAATSKGLPPTAVAALPVVYSTMHMSWGLGYLLSPRDLAGSSAGPGAEPRPS